MLPFCHDNGLKVSKNYLETQFLRPLKKIKRNPRRAKRTAIRVPTPFPCPASVED